MKKYYIANWKMNLHTDQAVEFIQQINNCDTQDFIGIAPSFTMLHTLKEHRTNKKFAIGAQNVASHGSGAFTGEVSASMLNDSKVDFVIIGHSERRHIYGETNDEVHEKVIQAHTANLNIILCVGETHEQKELGQTHMIIQEQIPTALKDLSIEKEGQLIIAYEPVWSIGTGLIPSLEQIDEVHKLIHTLLGKLGFNAVILYGGSVNLKNHQKLSEIASVDGFLIGGASLDVKTFMEIAGVKSILL